MTDLIFVSCPRCNRRSRLFKGERGTCSHCHGPLTDEPRNPVVRTTALNAYPGWQVREYQDGTFDADQIGGVGLSPGCDSFVEAVAFARDEQRRSDEAEREAESRFGDEDYRRDVRGFNDDSPYDHGAGGGDPDDGWL